VAGAVFRRAYRRACFWKAALAIERVTEPVAIHVDESFVRPTIDRVIHSRPRRAFTPLTSSSISWPATAIPVVACTIGDGRVTQGQCGRRENPLGYRHRPKLHSAICSPRRSEELSRTRVGQRPEDRHLHACPRRTRARACRRQWIPPRGLSLASASIAAITAEVEGDERFVPAARSFENFGMAERVHSVVVTGPPVLLHRAA
jgi:hypothetical protein